MSGWSGTGRDRIAKETRDSVLDCMDDGELMTAVEIAARRKRSTRGTLMVLQRMLELKLVERTTEKTPGWGGRRTLWRKLPDGYEAPLYEPKPGQDARALDAALGGHTYARKPKPSI